MIARLALLLCLVAMLGVPAADAAPANNESFDMIYLSEARPVVVRMQLTADGKTLLESWNRFADGLFAKLDADKNGMLDEKELKRLNPTLSLLTGAMARIPADLQQPVSEALLKVMSREAFGEFLQKNGFGSVRLPPLANPQPRGQRGFRRGGQPTPDELDKALLELLDADKNGKLSVLEFTAGIAILSKLDVDENELINTEELLRRPQSPFFVSEFDNGMAQQQSPGVELAAITRKGSDATLARRMASRYGPKPSGGGTSGPAPVPSVDGFGPPPAPRPEPTVRRLGKKDLKLSDEQFGALDQDGDGELDMEELGRFGQNAKQEVEIAISLGKAASVKVIQTGQSPVKVFPGTRGTDVAIEVPGVRLDLIAPPTVPSEVFRTSLRSRYLDRFPRVDRDGNGYVDRDEAANNDSLFAELFTLLDRDSDGKIYEKEIVAALDEVQDLAAVVQQGAVTVELNEMGRGIFGLIDADADNRLSIRELREMPKLVSRFDANKDGSLATSEVPRRFEATLAAGFGTIRPQSQPARFGLPMNVTRAQTGPLWFQKMDRNRDGDVSRREFLGTDEQFRKLDADGDGLISQSEAEK